VSFDRIAQLAAIVLAACGTVPSSAAWDTGGDPIPGFAPYPGALHLCSEHITGAPGPGGKPGPHIQWSAFWSSDSTEQVVEHYLSTLGRENHFQERGEDLWRFPRDRPRRVLSIEPSTSSGPWSRCKAAPPSAKTVLVISTMIGGD
jgi:hypothetical protein